MLFIHPQKDRWHAPRGEDGPPVSIPAEPHLLLELPQWHAARAQWPAHLPVGLLLANDQDVEALDEDLHRFALLALRFPKWTDGRAYSQARLLRSRFGFAGQIRATGDVLVDMLPLLARTGFDAAVLRADQSIDAAERALEFFNGHYQGDTHQKRPPFALPPGSAERLVCKPEREFIQQGASI